MSTVQLAAKKNVANTLAVTVIKKLTPYRRIEHDLVISTEGETVKDAMVQTR